MSGFDSVVLVELGKNAVIIMRQRNSRKGYRRININRAMDYAFSKARIPRDKWATLRVLVYRIIPDARKAVKKGGLKTVADTAVATPSRKTFSTHVEHTLPPSDRD